MTEEDPTPEERIQLATVLHPGCIVTVFALVSLAWGILGWWWFRK
jgi:hypothetical protein